MSYTLKSSLGYQTNLAATVLKTNFTKLIQPKFGIAAEQFATLKILSDDKEVTQTQLAELLGKDKTTVGRSIESLTKKGLLRREGVQNDKRANKIVLTSQAKNILAEATPLAEKFNEAVKAKFTQEEIEIYFKVLDTILQESQNIEFIIGEA